MKYLVRSMPKISQGTPAPPLLLSFWFWEAGQQLERSLIGCVRSLIWQLLQDERSKHPTLQAIGSFANATWTKSRLETCLLAALKRTTHLPLLVFLDGIDEAGPEADALLNLFETLAEDVPELKLCISSRPEQIFVDALSSYPKLRMQYLNEVDINAIIREELLNSPKISRMVRSPDQSDLLRLRDSIMRRAQGVILWVKLVIGSLLRGLRNCDTIEILERRLEELPAELDALYGLMLRRNNSDNQYYAETAGFYFRLIIHNGVVLSVPAFCLAVDDHLRKRYLDPETGWDMTTVGTDFDCEQTITWINVRTAGLLEVRRFRSSLRERTESFERVFFDGSQCLPLTRFLDEYAQCFVDFIHRTARTYLLDTVSGREVLSACTKTDDELDHLHTETLLVLLGVLESLEGLIAGQAQLGHLPATPFCNCVPDFAAFERVCNGLLKRAHLATEALWTPGMGSMSWFRCPFPSSKDGELDFCQLYCMCGRWDEVKRRLEALDRHDGPTATDRLSLLLVFVAYSLFHDSYPMLRKDLESRVEKGVEFLRWLMDKGADPNHMIVTPNDEEIWLYPYFSLWLHAWDQQKLVDVVQESDFSCTPKYVPTMSTCSEIFWCSGKPRDVYIWGNICPPKIVDSSQSRVYVLCNTSVEGAVPILYPVSYSDSQEIISRDERVGAGIAYISVRIGIMAVHPGTGYTECIQNVQSRGETFSSLSEAFQFMGKTPESIKKWAVSEEAKLRRRREKEDKISLWKKWVFGDNTQGSKS